MVVLVALITLAPILFLGLAPSVRASGSIIQNTATGYVFDDRNSSLSTLDTLVTGQKFGRTLYSYQQWNLTAVAGGYFTFSSTRFLTNSTIVVQAQVDGLPGQGLVASIVGSNFEYVNPYGAGTIYSFLFPLVKPTLAITASETNDDQLTLRPYDPTNTLQHWVFYNATLPSPTASPESLLMSPIPIPLAPGDPESRKL